MHWYKPSFEPVQRSGHKRGRYVTVSEGFLQHEDGAQIDLHEMLRQIFVRACAKAPIQGEVYKSVSKFLGDIDAMAECLTGDRKHLHEKPHST